MPFGFFRVRVQRQPIEITIHSEGTRGDRSRFQPSIPRDDEKRDSHLRAATRLEWKSKRRVAGKRLLFTYIVSKVRRIIVAPHGLLDGTRVCIYGVIAAIGPIVDVQYGNCLLFGSN